MKFSTFVLSVTLATVNPLVVGQPHRHAHRHPEKRNPVTEMKYVPGPTVIRYELNGKEISKEEVERGLANGSLVRVGGNVEAAPIPAVTSEESAPKDEYTSVSSETASPAEEKPEEEHHEEPAPEEEPEEEHHEEPAPKEEKPEGEHHEEPAQEGPGETYGNDTGSGGEGVDKDFPDGELDCDHFPSEYGAISIDWASLGGWAGLQKVKYTHDGRAVNHIETPKSGPCDEGMMCSYACPPGYLKAQWPEAQGATGQSVGGIECKNGKLHLPRASTSKKLCVKGTGGVKVHNKVGKSVPVCRTDYPGTEEMVIPATLNPASSEPYDLSCPNADTYYQWQGKPTSAQYYVNNAGLTNAEACTWSESGSDKGNWAPVNLGVGKNQGTWLSIQANAPTNPNAKLNFNIKIVGDDIGGDCKYENGTYYQNGNANDKGCTVQVRSGDGTFEFY